MIMKLFCKSIYRILIRTICDVGTCAGWHAIELAKLGHSVVGTDISETVIEKAKENSIQFENIDVKFIKDDVLKSFLKSEQFDLITDRGTFHSMHGFRIPSITELYINTVKRLLKPGGIFMIKGMSIDEKRFNVGHFEELSELRIKSQMPYHFGPHELVETFNSDMEFIENWQSVFQTQNLKDPAIAEVAVFKNVNNGEI